MAEPTGLYTTDLIILVGLLVVNTASVFATYFALAGRFRGLRDEVLAAGLGRADEKGSRLVRTPGGDLRIAVHEGLDDSDRPVWQVCLDSSAGTVAVLHTATNEAAAVLRAAREAHARGLGDPR